jgi:hypothetical protein
MRDNKEQVPSVAAATQPGWSGFDVRSATQENGNFAGESACPAHAKRPYGKPTYRYEKVFETMALSCGKVGGVEAQCRFGPRKNS